MTKLEKTLVISALLLWTIVLTAATTIRWFLPDEGAIAFGDSNDVQVEFDGTKLDVHDGTNTLMSLTDSGTTGMAAITGGIKLGATGLSSGVGDIDADNGADADLFWDLDSGATGTYNTGLHFRDQGTNHFIVTKSNGNIFLIRDQVPAATDNDVWIQDGSVSIDGNFTQGRAGAFTAAASCDLTQDAAAGAIPVLEVDQDDTDESFINFVGTSAASAGASISSWTTGNSIQGFVRIEINGAEYWLPYYSAPTS